MPVLRKPVRAWPESAVRDQTTHGSAGLKEKGAPGDQRRPERGGNVGTEIL